jgi:hypothetical protein
MVFSLANKQTKRLSQVFQADRIMVTLFTIYYLSSGGATLPGNSSVMVHQPSTSREDEMIKRSTRIGVAGLVAVFAALVSASLAFAQAGSTGGTIGKQGKSAAGGEEQSIKDIKKATVHRREEGTSERKSAPKIFRNPTNNGIRVDLGNADGADTCGRKIAGPWEVNEDTVFPATLVMPAHQVAKWEFKSDGPLGGTTFLDNKGERRRYSCQGNSYTIDNFFGITLTLSPDGRRLDGECHDLVSAAGGGCRIHAVRKSGPPISAGARAF